ncbi:MAG: hypothetical protein JNJ83_06310 [Verrucomicrobiaceae bacterium]|nr:hypothetical protein [Verrucomicrobiaceae bacterium]
MGHVRQAVAAEDSKPRAKTAPTELVFGNKATLSGRLEQIKTNDADGNAAFPFFLTTRNKIVVKAAADFDPGDTDEELEGMEVKLIGGDDSALEAFLGKNITICGRVSSGTGLHCHAFGLFVDSVKNIEEKPAGGEEAKVTTPEAGSALRKALCDAFRVPMIEEVNGQAVVFKIHKLNVIGEWAFIVCSLQLADDKEVDWSKTKYKSAAKAGDLENNAAGLLKKDEKGQWSVIEHSFNHTDVAWIGWDKKHGVSPKLFE